jgi:hypothetical protein
MRLWSLAMCWALVSPGYGSDDRSGSIIESCLLASQTHASSVIFLSPVDRTVIWQNPAFRDPSGAKIPVQLRTNQLSVGCNDMLHVYLDGRVVYNASVEDTLIDINVSIPERYGGDRFYNSLMRMGLSIGDEECGYFRYLEAVLVRPSPDSSRSIRLASDFARFSFGCDDIQYVDERVSESRAQAST